MHAYYKYPETTKYGKVIPKNKIYEKASISTSLKNKIVNQIDKIIWLHKLSPDTINLQATDTIKEIQVFDINLKQDTLDEEVLKAIDKAIPFPIIFQIKTNNHVQIKSAYKRVHESDANKWVVDTYFSSEWINLESEKDILPSVLNLEKLYETTLTTLMPHKGLKNLTIKDKIEAHKELQKLQKEYEQLKVKRSKEKQFNKKVALNTELKSLENKIESLKNETNRV